MKRRARSPRWPTIGVVGLFVLSVLAPQAWRTLSAPAAEGESILRPGKAAASVPGHSDDQPARSPWRAERNRRDVRATRVQPGAINELRVAQIRPPITDRIELDPSIAETPSLPAPDFSTGTDPLNGESALQGTPKPAGDLVESAIPRVSLKASPPMAGSWPQPVALSERLTALLEDAQLAGWARDVLERLEQLGCTDPQSTGEMAVLLGDLRFLVAEADELAEGVPELNRKARLLRAGYSLARRLEIWEGIHTIGSSGASRLDTSGFRPLGPLLEDVERRIAPLRDARPWRAYLLIDDARTLARDSGSMVVEQRSELARRILNRLESPALSAEQRALLESAEFVRLATALRQYVCQPVDYRNLLKLLEQYEQWGSAATAKEIAQQYELLRWSPVETIGQLAAAVSTHYRNANVRVAVSGELINRLLPGPERLVEDVNDNILGASVRGRSESQTRLRVFLLPDRLRWRLGLEAHGEVASETKSYKGPAVFYNEGDSQYQARKLMLIDRRGVRIERARAEARSNSDLTGMATNFDDVPLVNLLVRAIARQQYDNQAQIAEWEVEGRLASRVSSQMDREVNKHVANAEQEFQQKFISPLARLSLNPTTVDMHTTSERLIVRYRLAALDQLSAHTPRPQAPADSLLSVQIHQTAVGNTIEQFRLGGRRADLHAFYREMADAFDRSDLQPPEDLPEGVMLHLAEQEPVRVRFANGQVTVTLKVDELSSGRRRWRNFAVRTSYKPSVDGLHATLVRDGYVEFPDSQLRSLERVALAGIFSKVFPRNPRFDLISKRISDHPKLNDLQVTQFVVREGWIGVALGPQRQWLNRVAEGEIDGYPRR